MEIISGESKREEERLKILLGKAEEKEDSVPKEYKISALGELAATENQMGAFYESLEDFQKSKKFYRRAITDYSAAMRLSTESGSNTSYHIFKELREKSGKSLDRVRARENGLIKKFSITTSLTGLVTGLFFIAPMLTGNTIANLSPTTSSFTGGGLIVIGLIGGFVWYKNRK